MVISRLTGGLGNQMFQYAVGRAIADRHSSALGLDISEYEQDTSRRYALDQFAIRAEVMGKGRLDALGLATGDSITMLGRRLLGRWNSAGTYRERHFHFDPNVERLRPPIYLVGYWQSERYFTGIAQHLREEFVPRTPASEANQRMLEFIHNHLSISLHVRRGDYVTDRRTNAFHGVCPVSYYERALAHMERIAPSARLFVFSDDQQWAAENIRSNLPTTHVMVNGPGEAVWDLILMKNCHHHVIANSSFSWWAAWLSPSPKKVVIAPRHWLKSDTNETDDRVPSDWIRI